MENKTKELLARTLIEVEGMKLQFVEEDDLTPEQEKDTSLQNIQDNLTESKLIEPKEIVDLLILIENKWDDWYEEWVVKSGLWTDYSFG